MIASRLANRPERLAPARRAVRIAVAAWLMFGLLAGCDPFAGSFAESMNNAINAIDRARQTIGQESANWRGELPKLTNALQGIESQAASDARSAIADATSQVQDMATQTIQMSDAKAQSLISQAGVEFRCNAGFVRQGVLDQLRSLADDLRYFLQNRRHQGDKPVHAVCWINPTALSLIPSSSGFALNTSNMPEKNIVMLFGYNFRPDALPALDVQDSTGRKVRAANLRAAYVTRYQINLDFSTEKFEGVTAGARIVLNWPDQADPNTINLTINQPGRIRLSNAVFTPAAPIATKDAVSLRVTVRNEGGSRTSGFSITWKPDPTDNNVLDVSQLPLEAGESRTVSLPGYTYRRDGVIQSVVSLSNGDDSLSASLTVAKAPPAAADVICQGPFGGGGGSLFDDRDQVPPGTRITGVTVRSGTRIDAIQMVLASGTLTAHGGGGGTRVAFTLGANEYLTSIEGRSGTRVDSLRMRTNTGRPSAWFGASGGSANYAVSAPAGYEIFAFFGRAGSELDAIGACMRRR